ncbi:hypothetical protein MHAEM_03387 [Mycolicibacterium phlei]|nr:hypothetical protein [Mycolicibacterium phlei]
MVVHARGQAVHQDRRPRRPVRGEHGQAEQRDHHDHPGDDAGGRQIGHRPHADHLQRVDLLVDPHRADLCGRAGPDGGGQPDSRDQRCGQPGVDERGEEAGHGLHADVGQRVEALHTDDRPGEERQEGDDHDRAADEHQSACAQAHSGHRANQFDAVVHQRVAGRADSLGVEAGLFADPFPERVDLVDRPRHARIAGTQRRKAHVSSPGIRWR